MDPINPLQRLAFRGKGVDLFVVLIVNWLLTIVTLGLYYPWAKVRKLKYYYEHTELDGHPFHFHGTGREMFIGFIKAVGLFAVLGGGGFALYYFVHPLLLQVVLAAGVIALFPLVIHGTFRYRMGRSSWRGIHFGYRGELGPLYKQCLTDGLITVITFGFYAPWFTIHLRNYVLGNVRWGSSRFEYKGDGPDYFILNLKCYFFTLFTLGGYWFRWRKELFDYYVNNLSWHLGDDRVIRFKSTATGAGMFRLIIGNLLLILFTLGFGYAWAEVRTMQFVTRNIEFIGDADLGNVVQTEQEHKQALADELGDLMDIGIFL